MNRRHLLAAAFLFSAFSPALFAAECPVRIPTQSATVFIDLGCFIECAGSSFIAHTFDDIPRGVILSDSTLGNVSFFASHAPIIIARDSETYTPADFPGVSDPASFRLHATTVPNILSPGGVKLAPGPDPKFEDDDITLAFDPPVAAVGFDLLTQLADGLSLAHVTVISAAGIVLHEGQIPISWAGLDPDHLDHLPIGKTVAFDLKPGSDFWGIVSESCDIAFVIIDDQDNDSTNPDCNLAIDSLRVFPSPLQAPDLDANSIIDFADLISLLDSWGDYSTIQTGLVHWKPADLNRDSSVNTDDLLALIVHLRLIYD